MLFKYFWLAHDFFGYIFQTFLAVFDIFHISGHPVPRVLLGIWELLIMEHGLPDFKACNKIKFATLVSGSVSTLLLTVNSSVNLIIYSLISCEFRRKLQEKICPFLAKWPWSNMQSSITDNVEMNVASLKIDQKGEDTPGSKV